MSRFTSFRQIPWGTAFCAVLIAIGLCVGLSRPMFLAYAAVAALIAVSAASLKSPSAPAPSGMDGGGGPAAPPAGPLDHDGEATKAPVVTPPAAALPNQMSGDPPPEPMRARDVIFGVLVAVAALIAFCALALLFIALIIAIVFALGGGPGSALREVRPDLIGVTALRKEIRGAGQALRAASPKPVRATYSLTVAFDDTHDTWTIAPELALRQAVVTSSIGRELEHENWHETPNASYRDTDGVDYVVFRGPASKPISASTPSLFNWKPGTFVNLRASVAEGFPVGADSRVNVEAPEGLVGDTDPDAETTEPVTKSTERTVISIHAGADAVDVTLVGAAIRKTPEPVRDLIKNNLVGLLIPGGALGVWWKRWRRKKKNGGTAEGHGQPPESTLQARTESNPQLNDATAPSGSPRRHAEDERPRKAKTVTGPRQGSRKPRSH